MNLRYSAHDPKTSLSSPKNPMNSTLPALFPGSPTFKLTAPQETVSHFLSTISQTPQSKQLSKKRNSNSLEASKNQYKLDLNIDHNILRAMTIADKELEALKDNSSLFHGFKRLSAGMKLLGDYQDRPELINTIQEHMLPVNTKKAQERLKDASAAQSRWINTERTKWIKSRGLEPQFNDSKGFIEFLRQLFDALDEDESGKITADELILPLLAYGLCPDAYYIESVLDM